MSSPSKGATPTDTETPHDATSSIARRAMSASASATASWASRIGKQHGELVAGEPGKDVGRAKTAAHRLGNAPERDVSRPVTPRVVDGLQPVHVDQEQCPAAAVAVAEGEMGVQLLAEAPAVHEARERVVLGDVAKLVLEALALGHVLDLNDPGGA